MALSRTVVVLAIVLASTAAHTTYDPGLLTRPEVVQGTPTPVK